MCNPPRGCSFSRVYEINKGSVGLVTSLADLRQRQGPSRRDIQRWAIAHEFAELTLRLISGQESRSSRRSRQARRPG